MMDHPTQPSTTFQDDDDDIFYLLNEVQKNIDQGKQRTDRGRSSSELDTTGNGNSKFPHPNYDDSDIEMFVDINGVPTDTFLESLKQDPVAASQHLSNQLENDFQLRSPDNFTAPKVMYQSRYLDSSSDSDIDSDLEGYDKETPHRNRKNFFQYMQDENRQSSANLSSPSPTRSRSPTGKKKSVTLSSSKKRIKKKQSTALREYPGHPTPIPIESVMKAKEKKATLSTKRLSRSVDSGQGSGAMSGRKRRPVAPTSKTSKSTDTLRMSHNSECNNSLKLTKQAEEKTESLKLRVKGQLNSIRVLETQLAEANHSIAVRDLELATALKRVNQLESREKELSARREHDDEVGRRVGKTDEGKVYQIKTELIALNARFNDEKSRRARAEERLRIIKEFCEKQKLKTAEVEQKNVELEGVLKQLHAKLQKKKQEVKTSAKDMTVQRVKVVEKDSQLQTSKNQNLKNTRIIKDLRHDNDRLKEELRLLRREVSSAEDKNRRSQLELEVLRERQTATKLAYRLQSQNQTLSQNSISPQHRHLDKSVNQDYRSHNQSGSSSYHSNSISDTKPDGARGCPYSRPRSRSRSRSQTRQSNNITSNTGGMYDKLFDGDGNTVSDDTSVDSYDVDQLLTHHHNVSNDISNSMSTANLPVPPSQDREHQNPSDRSREDGDRLQDVSLLSDSTGMGEEFDRLQKMYKRVQGKNHT